MVRGRRSLPVLVALSAVVSACGSDANEAIGSTVDVSLVPSTIAADTEPDETSPEGSAPQDGETHDDTPAPRSRPTTLADVDRLDPNDPGGFPRALVPGDAFAASEVVLEATPADVEAIGLELQTEGHILIPVDIESCTLIAVWSLPNPSALLVGYEEHPDLDCVRSVPRTVFFVIPTSGENSEGTWDYETTPAISLRRGTG
jgi:hypothetical protein